MTDGLEFLRSLPSESVDGIFTDPPWGKGPPIVGQAIWKDLLVSLDKEASRVLRPKGKCLVWIGLRMLSETLASFTNLEYKWAVFCKYIPPRFIASFESAVDPILFFSRRGQKYPHMPGRALPQIYLKPSTGRKDTRHPCARPIDIVKKILRDWFKEGEYVVDPFAGSDTTGVACRELNLAYDSCEIDPAMYVHGTTRHMELLPLTYPDAL